MKCFIFLDDAEDENGDAGSPNAQPDQGVYFKAADDHRYGELITYNQ